jgi:hypothetical protein
VDKCGNFTFSLSDYWFFRLLWDFGQMFGLPGRFIDQHFDMVLNQYSYGNAWIAG